MAGSGHLKLRAGDDGVKLYFEAVRIGVRLTVTAASIGEFLADCQALEGAGADLLLVDAGELDPALVCAAMAVTTTRAALVAPPGSDAQLATLDVLARGRLQDTVDESWVETAFPADREEWVATLRRHDEAGATGVIVSNDPRLLDLLRNADVVDDRSDLQLAQG